MLSRRAAYHGLLTCLVALLALGMQPQRAEKVAAARESSPNAHQERDDEESEEESEEEPGATSLRRRVLVWALASGEARSFAAWVSAPTSTLTSLPTRNSADLAVRNGIGGPLRL